MVSESYKISVPGSIMLLGEHAVLFGYPALAAAINQRVTVELKPENQQKIIIKSSLLGEYQCELHDFKSVKPFQFILATIAYFQAELRTGFTLQIDSEFSDRIGLGSSAAITVATAIALQQWLQHDYNPFYLFQICLSIIRQVQGMGSGSDLAASIFGGVVAVIPETEKSAKIIPISQSPPIALIYCGYKTPTATVVEYVRQKYVHNPTHYQNLFQSMATLTRAGWEAIENKNWSELGIIFKQQHQIMQAIGVSDATLDKIIATLNQNSSLWGAKISGSGLGDCIVALPKSGHDPISIPTAWQTEGICQIRGTIDPRGLIIL